MREQPSGIPSNVLFMDIKQQSSHSRQTTLGDVRISEEQRAMKTGACHRTLILQHALVSYALSYPVFYLSPLNSCTASIIATIFSTGVPHCTMWMELKM